MNEEREGIKLPRPRMREAFRSALRSTLMNEAVVALAPRPRGNAPAWLRPALVAAAIALLVVTGAGKVGADSVAGEPAFALKRAAEEAQLSLTFDDLARVQFLADLSDRRLDELRKVADRPDAAPTVSVEFAAAVARFRSAVDALRASGTSDQREAAEDVAGAAREKHEAVLEQLKQRLPEDAKPGIERAIEEERKDLEPTEHRGSPKPSDRATPKSSRTPEPERTPSRSPEPTRTPRPTESPRATERAIETPKPSATND